jgi:integrase
MPLTSTKIKALTPTKHRRMILDSDGLYLELGPRGPRSWRYRFIHNKRPGKINLGRYPLVSLAEARQRRTALAQGIAAGKSPSEQERAAQRAKERGETLKQFSERYLREVEQRYPRRVAPIRRYFEREIWPSMGSRPMAQIQLSELRAVIFAKREAGKLQAALEIRNILKRLWDFAVICEVADRNLLAAIPGKFVAETKSRTRALDLGELAAFLPALEKARISHDHKAALELILLCLTRKGEMRLACWPEFNLEAGEWAIPEEHSKGGAQIVYLSRQAIAILEQLKARRKPGQSCVFPARGGLGLNTPISARTLNDALARVPVRLKHFTVHDLRRSSATNLSEQEYAADVIEKALNHRIKGVRGIYNRAQYATQRRAMLQTWADCLDGLKTGAVSEARANVEK